MLTHRGLHDVCHPARITPLWFLHNILPLYLTLFVCRGSSVGTVTRLPYDSHDIFLVTNASTLAVGPETDHSPTFTFKQHRAYVELYLLSSTSLHGVHMKNYNVFTICLWLRGTSTFTSSARPQHNRHARNLLCTNAVKLDQPELNRQLQ
jgi:hypothetical protein